MMRKDESQQKRFYGQWPTLRSVWMSGLCLAATLFPVASFAQMGSGGYIAHANVSTYVCQTANEARMQDINPDYLVPGCALREAAENDQKPSSTKRIMKKNRVEN